MRIPSALAVDLELLSDALDIPNSDIATTLAVLMSDAASAVSSYVGLSVRMFTGDTQIELTTLDSDHQIASIKASLRVPLEAEPTVGAEHRARIVLILYAAKAGAFVDLAADIAWITKRSPDEVLLDHDLNGGIHHRPAESLRAQSAINQAIGVLISQGRTDVQARAELGSRANESGLPWHEVAIAVLAALPTTVPRHGL